MTPRTIIGIDPGTTQSAWVLMVVGRLPAVLQYEIEDNREFLGRIRGKRFEVCPLLVPFCGVEMFESFGMAVGKDVFETVYWVGRFAEAWSQSMGAEMEGVYRKEVKMHLCQSMRAKDKNIRQALIDRYGAPGVKKAPNRVTYGISSHLWSALAVAVTLGDRLEVKAAS